MWWFKLAVHTSIVKEAQRCYVTVITKFCLQKNNILCIWHMECREPAVCTLNFQKNLLFLTLGITEEAIYCWKAIFLPQYLCQNWGITLAFSFQNSEMIQGKAQSVANLRYYQAPSLPDLPVLFAMACFEKHSAVGCLNATSFQQDRDILTARGFVGM